MYSLRPLVSDFPIPVAGWTALLQPTLFLAMLGSVSAGAG
jgi:hypothetical protein